MVKLDELIGEKIIICPAVAFDRNHPQGMIYAVKLHGVEAGGIWIESDVLTRGMQSTVQRIYHSSLSKEKALVYFFPYSQIIYLLSWSSEIDEESFGLLDGS